MSGLCGIVDFSGRPVRGQDVEAMVAVAPYRGPDGVGWWRGEGAALAFQALHVTEESVFEQQPLVDPVSGLVVAADARIDDREGVARALGFRLGDRHATNEVTTDLDLVVAAVRAWGIDAAARLVGDFAIVAWDPAERRLVALRDPMGMRPLVYRWDGRRLHVASEVRQILAAPDVPARTFEPALAAHLLNDFEHETWTAYEDVFQVPAGHALVVDERGPTLRRTWEVDPERRLRLASEAEYAEAFREVFATAVRCRLRSRRGVGILLSGGVDSGSVASMAGLVLRERAADPAALRTYSWAFRELSEVDERHVSDHIVAHYGFASVPIEADERWPLRDFPKHGPARDGPFCGVYQALIEHALACARKDGVGLMLVGLRGDVLVGESVTDTLGLLAHGRWRAAAREVQTFRRMRGTSLLAALRRLVLVPLVEEAVPGLARRLRRGRRADRRRAAPWVRSEFLARTGMDAARQDTPRVPAGLRGVARRARHASVFGSFPLAVMTWTERLHAEVGLAFADPWSDRRLAEFVLATPPWMVNRVDEPKRLAREAMRGVIPDAALRGTAKVPPTPLYRRAVEDRAARLIMELFDEPVAEALGYVDGEILRAHAAEIRRDGRDEPAFWQAITLEMWLRAFPPT